MGKWKLQLRKIGGSLHILVPAGLVEKLGIKGDSEILADLQRFGDLIKEMCKTSLESKQKVILTTNDEEVLIGYLLDMNKTSITFNTDKGNFFIPYDLIKSITKFEVAEE